MEGKKKVKIYEGNVYRKCARKILGENLYEDYKKDIDKEDEKCLGKCSPRSYLRKKK